MNSTTAAIIGVLVIVLIGGGIFYSMRDSEPSPTATSTPTGEEVGEQTPKQPTVTTGTTATPADTTVVVSGTVVPNGAITSYWYEFGTTATLGNKTANQIVGSGYVVTGTPAYITGLSKNTTYYFRLVAENEFGKVAGEQRSFKTTEGVPAPVGSVPSVKTTPATGMTRTTANVSGEVVPNRAATQQWFEYGKTPNLGRTTAFTAVGDGTATVEASASLTNLDADTTYYYRLNAQNQFGTVNGETRSFKTLGPAATATAAPTVTTRAAEDIEEKKATLRATIAPNGLETKYWFEYSTNSLLGSVLLSTTNKKSAGANASPATVEKEEDITSLKANTTYYFRVVAENSKGTTRGEKQTFKTN